jgi:hypothetical protein
MPGCQSNLIIILGLLLSLNNRLFGQQEAELLIETHWRHTFTLHVETNSVIQQAGEAWRYYLYFRYDSVCEHSLNDRVHQSPWTAENRQLHLVFRHAGAFEIVRLNSASLDLKCLSPNGRDTLLYHFIRVEKDQSPLGKKSATLPIARVETMPADQQPALAGSTGAAGETLLPDSYDPAQMVIELVGGGYYGGINPVIRDFITINRQGRLIHEFESVQGKRMIRKNDISPAQLDKFTVWAEAQQYFSMEALYDCKTPECERRKNQQPRPVPLRLAISKGDYRKMVTISIWGLDRNGKRYVSYPPALDHIIDAIQKMAHTEIGN